MVVCVGSHVLRRFESDKHPTVDDEGQRLQGGELFLSTLIPFRTVLYIQ